jgi:hypothetical protein
VFGTMNEFSFSGCGTGNEDTYLQENLWKMFGYEVFPLGGQRIVFLWFF